MRVLSIFGTRPEAIKMAPVVKELGKHPTRMESVVCVTAQHRQMLDQVLKLFAIRPDIDLDLMEENQNLASLTARGITALTEVLQRVRPDLVLVQGDTTTAMVASLAAFYQQIAVGHVEAGLRTRNRYSPFPEEINRRLIGALATYHFAPTQAAADTLSAEGISVESIFITGNTVIDALLWTICQPPSLETIRFLIRHGIPIPIDNYSFYGEQAGDACAPAGDKHRLILVTAHRRENFGRPLENICRALQAIVHRNPDVKIIYPVHMNPNVRGPVHGILNGHERIHLTEPLAYEAFAHLMSQAYLILTDSGGIQEEAPSLGKPVLVMRTETERPEAVTAGTAKVVGVDSAVILEETERLLYDHAAYQRMAKAINPYGDGKAAERIVKAIVSEGEELPRGRRYNATGKANLTLYKSSQAAVIQRSPVVGYKVQEPLLKRSLDLFLASIGLALSAPIWLLIAVGIKLEDGGPVFYSQERVGQGGRRFRSWKFRSMISDSDAKFGPLQATDGDSRVTRIGRYLRAAAMDELPQLWSIFKGEMSFVGPRALLPEEIEVNGNGELIPLEKIPGYEERHRVCPGLTGLAQVYAPRDIPRKQKFRYDLLYIKKQRLWLDIKLILLSVWISVRGNWEARTRKF